ncbi:Mannan endo-1,6-alpha-mannosidase DCW1-like protein 1 [Phlyctema vagabunda]|uniref:mannan endo-1,6-alpha-mannosidase n=1 Tax=Phlyctema vagabunda TaxID=108571 RepID=A0ABR4P4F5_9HELO
MAKILQICVVLLLLQIKCMSAIEIDIDDPDSIRRAASEIAHGLMSYYKGNETGFTPGLLPYPPYYWWQSGALMGTMVNYYRISGDPTYNSIVSEGLLYQTGPDDDYMPQEQRSSLGNDDQAFWGMAALAAAESNFPDPPQGSPSWLSLAQAVFNEQIGRWDTTLCGGGLRWQIYQILGYNLKNTISNGALFNIASRLARYTGDSLYSDWAIKIWDWLEAVGLIDEDYNVYDNAEAQNLNCTELDHNQWTYNAGVMLLGAATLYNHTGSELWMNRTWGLLNRSAEIYFPDGVMKDICEEHTACNIDQQSFKAYLSRWMAVTTQMAPFTYDIIIPLLRSSAVAAAAQCIGTAPKTDVPPGQVCGQKWYLNGTWDGSDGAGQQMSALEVVLGTLIQKTRAPVTTSTGGTSISNPTAGHNTSDTPPLLSYEPVNRADRIGAWFLTGFIVVATLWSTYFMVSRSFEFEGLSKLNAVAVMQRREKRRPVLEKGKGKQKVSANVETLGTLPEMDEEKQPNMIARPRPISVHAGTIKQSNPHHSRNSI